MMEDLKFFQACKHVYLKQYLKRKYGPHFQTFSLRTRLGCLTRGVPIICILFLDFARFVIAY